MRTLTTLLVAAGGVAGLHAQVTIAAAAAIVYLISIYPRKKARR